MKKKILYEEFMDKGLVGMNLKETNENGVKIWINHNKFKKTNKYF